MTTWNLQNIWNEVLINERKKIKPRSHIYASEIGKNHWERYQKMLGTRFTNVYGERVLRKFAAGNFFEDMIGHVLQKIGILKSSQKRIEIQANKDHLEITGYADFEAGGMTNWDEARTRIREADFPEAISNIALSLIKYFEETYPTGLEKKLYEIKSVNSQVFWAKKDFLEEAYPWHVMQVYTYMRYLGYDKGTILYISKDDLTVKEIDVKRSPELDKIWLDDVKKMTKYYNAKQEPPLPDAVVFDKRKKFRFSAKRKLEAIGTEKELNAKAIKIWPDKLVEVAKGYKIIVKGCYTTNWEIDFSPYRGLITGTKNDEEYDAWLSKAKSEAAMFNEERIKDVIINKLSI